MENFNSSVNSIQFSDLNEYLLLEIYDAFIKNQEIKDPSKEALFHYNLTENSVKKVIWDKAALRTEFAITQIANYRNLLEICNELFGQEFHDYFKTNLITKNIMEKYLEGYWYTPKIENIIESSLSDYYKNQEISDKLLSFKTALISGWINDIHYKLARKNK